LVAKIDGFFSVVYLRVSPETAMMRARSRGRPEEENIDIGVFKRLQIFLDDWLYSISSDRLLIIDEDEGLSVPDVVQKVTHFIGE